MKSIYTETTYGVRRFEGKREMLDLSLVKPNWKLIAFILLVFTILIIISPLPLKIVALFIAILLSAL